MTVISRDPSVCSRRTRSSRLISTRRGWNRVVRRSLVRRGTDSLQNMLKYSAIFPGNEFFPYSLKGSTVKRRTSDLRTTRGWKFTTRRTPSKYNQPKQTRAPSWTRTRSATSSGARLAAATQRSKGSTGSSARRWRKRSTSKRKERRNGGCLGSGAWRKRFSSCNGRDCEKAGNGRRTRIC